MVDRTSTACQPLVIQSLWSFIVVYFRTYSAEKEVYRDSSNLKLGYSTSYLLSSTSRNERIFLSSIFRSELVNPKFGHLTGAAAHGWAWGNAAKRGRASRAGFERRRHNPSILELRPLFVPRCWQVDQRSCFYSKYVHLATISAITRHAGTLKHWGTWSALRASTWALSQRWQSRNDIFGKIDKTLLSISSLGSWIIFEKKKFLTILTILEAEDQRQITAHFFSYLKKDKSNPSSIHLRC